MVEAIAFDFDGVLVGLDAHTEARKKAFVEFALSSGDERFIADDKVHEEAHEHGSHPTAIIGWVLQQQGLVAPDTEPSDDPLTHAVVARKKELYKASVDEGLEAMDGSVECVRWAAGTFGRSRVAIVTTASITEVRPFLERYNIQDAVGKIVTNENVGAQLKPDPLAYRIAAHYFGLDVNGVAIEDSVRGLQSAQTAGFRTVGVTTTHSYEQLHRFSDHIAPNLLEVPYLITAINSLSDMRR